MPLTKLEMKKTKVIILGGGFGGVYAALRLDKTLARRADVEVTLVSSDQELFVAEVGLAQSSLNELLSLVQLYKLSGADGKKISVTGNRRKSDCTMQSRYFPRNLMANTHGSQGTSRRFAFSGLLLRSKSILTLFEELGGPI